MWLSVAEKSEPSLGLPVRVNISNFLVLPTYQTQLSMLKSEFNSCTPKNILFSVTNLTNNSKSPCSPQKCNHSLDSSDICKYGISAPMCDPLFRSAPWGIPASSHHPLHVTHCFGPPLGNSGSLPSSPLHVTHCFGPSLGASGLFPSGVFIPPPSGRMCIRGKTHNPARVHSNPTNHN